jgi:7,8-dihydropterin-6-yl-methyl-4-(beta-D-ribofuranosyl)aminobenzene 5'-phosphate synthase
MNQGIGLRILVDNRAGDGFSTEHGFSLWIETEGQNILFDTGQGSALGHNACQMGIDLKKTDVVVLSHGHYDHSGGLAEVLALAPSAQVYAHAGVTRERYSLGPGEPRQIGMPLESQIAIEALSPDRLHWLKGPHFLSEHVGLTGPIPRSTNFEDTGGPFFLDKEGAKPDPIEDDLAMWIRTPGGLVVCVGCAHAGLVNTLNHIMFLEPGQPLRAVLGGFHLRAASEVRLDRTLVALKAFSPQLLVPCHCTGEKAVETLLHELGKTCAFGQVGAVFDW